MKLSENAYEEDSTGGSRGSNVALQFTSRPPRQVGNSIQTTLDLVVRNNFLFFVSLRAERCVELDY